MGSVAQDLRYAVRTLAKRPGFTCAAILTLALGIGANSSIFSVVNAVLLEPFPYPDAGRLVALHEIPLRTGGSPWEVSHPNFAEWREQSRSFDELAGIFTTEVTLRGGGEAVRVLMGHASAELFPMLGVEPVLGRVFGAEEDRPDGPNVVLLSWGAWQRRFGGDASVVGREIFLDGQSSTVIGVLPRDFIWLEGRELWGPLEPVAGAWQNRAVHLLRPVLGRLSPGVSLAEARREMDVIAARVDAEHPGEDPEHGVVLFPLRDEVTGTVRSTLLVLFAAVGCVLLIACANVADLLLARAAGRRREIAVRHALGAGRWRLVRQLVTESLVLAAAGGVVAVGLSLWAVDLLVGRLPVSIPRSGSIDVDGATLAFTFAAALGTGLVFGLLPAIRATRPRLTATLARRVEGGPGSLRRPGLQGWLVVFQVAAALVLSIGASLLVRSLARVADVDPGFEPRNLLTLSVSVAGSPTGDDSVATVAFYRRLRERLEALGGVRAASAVSRLPISGGDFHGDLTVEGRDFPPGETPAVSFRSVLPGYFRTLGFPVVRGRDFGEGDRSDTSPVLLVNEALARRFFPSGGALGSRIKVGPAGSNPWYEIVGVVADVHNVGLDAEPEPTVYFVHSQSPWRTMSVVVRTDSDPASQAGVVRDEILALGGELPVFDVTTMSDRIRRSLAPRRFNAVVLGAFAAMAVLLAAVGLYGVLAYSVARRTRELGVRMALGADRRAIVGLVLRQGMALVAAGLAAGWVTALGSTRLLAGLLHAVSPTDAVTFASIPAVLAAAAFLACYLPARRATRADPLTALREE